MVSQANRVQQCRKLVVLFTFVVSLTLTAHAAVLGVGGTAPPTALTPAASSSILASITGTIVTPTFTTDYTTWVKSDPTNNFCSGCLDFVYQFTNLGPHPNQRFSMSSFSGFMVDAGTNPFGVHDPNTVSRSMTLGGDVVSFNFNTFGNDIVPGETTVQLVIMTNALHFEPGFLSAQNGTAGSGAAFQPSVIPEPTSLMLMGTGVLALSGLVRKAMRG